MRNYARELATLAKKEDCSAEIQELETALALNNPIAKLSFDEFLTMLKLVVQTDDFVTGSTNTKTSMDMRLGLRLFAGENIPDHRLDPFSWNDVLNLKDPFFACVYQRMIAEVRLLDTFDCMQAFE